MREQDVVMGLPSWRSRRLRPPIERLAAGFRDPFALYHLYPFLSGKVKRRLEAVDGQLLPHTVSLETRTICNGRCSFCAASVQNRTRPDETMPDEVFAKVIDDLAQVRFGGRLAFYVNNEPLLDKRLPDMIATARKALPAAFLQVSTNGIKLTPDLALLLWDRGLDELFVNEYSEERTLSERIAKVIQNTPDTYCGKLHVALRPIHAVLLNRAGSSPNSEGGLKRSLPAFCNLPFTQINIVHDGQVSLCCQDLFVKSGMGNVMDDGVLGVWFGEKFKKARRDLLNMDRTQNPLCAVCDYPGFKTVSGPYRFLNRLVNLIR